ncbi:MAG: hypothetical protein R3C18_08375 [Planctomycetaceae bacterium]
MVAFNLPSWGSLPLLAAPATDEAGGIDYMRVGVVVLIIVFCFLVVYQVVFPLVLRRLRWWPRDTFAWCTFLMTILLFGVPIYAFWDDLMLESMSGTSFRYGLRAGLIGAGAIAAFLCLFGLSTPRRHKNPVVQRQSTQK